MSTFGADNHSAPFFPLAGRSRSSVAADALRTSFVTVLEESQRKEPLPDRTSEQKRSLEGISQRKSLDKHEIETSLGRHRQLDNEYQHRLDRRELSNEKPTAEPVVKTSVTTPLPVDTLWSASSATPPNIVGTQQNTAMVPPVALEQPATPTVPSSAESPATLPFPQTVTIGSTVLPNAPLLTVPVVNPEPKPPPNPSVFTIFTVSGRFGAEKKEFDDRKAEKRGVSLFGAFLPLSDDVDEPPSESVARRSTVPDESPERKPVEPANIEAPNKGKEGISLKELLETKTVVLTNEPYKEELPDRITPKKKTDSDAQTQADRVRFVQRVAAACQSAANRNGTVRIKLHPESLGSLVIRVSAKKGKLSVHFETETDAAKRLLLDSLGDLRLRLREMNVELEDCSVEQSLDHWVEGPVVTEHRLPVGR